MQVQSPEVRLFAHLRQCLAGVTGPVFLGLSGGIDSMVLLEALHRLAIPINAIHVHHGLQAPADEWARFCRQQCDQRGIHCHVEHLALSAQSNVEARARAGRYRAFSSLVGTGVLLTAQHQDDQAETLLLQLMRGAGVHGLAAMAADQEREKVRQLRPLLSLTRADIEQLAHQWQLEWIDDPSNRDVHYTRNWLRHRLLPLWQQRVPTIRQQLATSASHLQESAALLDQLAALDLQQVRQDDAGLSVPRLTAYSWVRQKNLLRYWLADKAPYRPGEQWLCQLRDNVMLAKADAMPQLALSSGRVARYRQSIYWLPAEVFTAPSGEYVLLPGGEVDVSALAIQHQQLESNVTASQWSNESYRGSFALVKSLLPLQVTFFTGGERLWYRRQHKQVSECWRASGIPPWVRPWLPLFYSRGELVAVAGIGVSDAVRDANAASETLSFVSWRLPRVFLGG